MHDMAATRAGGRLRRGQPWAYLASCLGALERAAGLEWRSLACLHPYHVWKSLCQIQGNGVAYDVFCVTAVAVTLLRSTRVPRTLQNRPARTGLAAAGAAAAAAGAAGLGAGGVAGLAAVGFLSSLAAGFSALGSAAARTTARLTLHARRAQMARKCASVTL